MSNQNQNAIDDPSLISIRSLRAQFTFVIPDYQRGFAWRREQWDDLWRDLVSTSKRESGDHFAGSLMLRPIADDARQREVVDGQQRLISIALLLRSLDESGLEIDFQHNEALQTYFDHFTGRDTYAAVRLGMHRSFYARNIESAAHFFRDKVASLSAEDKLKLSSTLMDRFKVFTLSIQPSFDIHVAFETINNRGRQLSILEKLKNRLIYLCSLLPNKANGEEAARHVHTSWKGIYFWLGKGEKLLDDDEFLRSHAVGWFRKEHKAEWLNRQLFDDDFSAQSPHEIDSLYITMYVASLERCAAWWYYLRHPRQLPDSACNALERLERASAGKPWPLLLWSLARCAEDDEELLANPKASSKWIKHFVEIVREAERFSVLVIDGNGRLSTVGQSDFNRSAYALAHPGTRIEDSLQPPPIEGPAAVAYASQHLRALVFNSADEDSEKTINSRFPWPGFFKPQTFIEVIADRLRRQGFYKWSLGKLLVYEWEQRLRGEKGLPEKRSWERFSWDDSVEHIYPQTPELGWKSSISLDDRSDALRNAIQNSLGNLLLLSRSRNSSLSNALYAGNVDPSRDKCRRYESGSYSEWQVAKVCPEKWTVSAIAARGIAMMRHAQRIWDFEIIPDDNEQWVLWLPILFGDAAEKIRQGAASNGVAVDGRSLSVLVKRFETLRPG